MEVAESKIATTMSSNAHLHTYTHIDKQCRFRATDARNTISDPAILNDFT